jgi:probable HAF family extracellular repeat protein
MRSSARSVLVLALVGLACGSGSPPRRLAIVGHVLTVRVTGPGSVSVEAPAADGGATACHDECSIDLTDGASVTLTPTPQDGASFTGWSGACSGTEPCTLTVEDDAEVSGAFEATAPPPLPGRFRLSVDLAGDGDGRVTSEPGGIDCGQACSAEFDDGTPVTLAPAPADGSTFGGWTGACSGTGACVVTLSEAANVTAIFARNPPPPPERIALTVELAGDGEGRVTSAPAGIDCGGTCTAELDAGTKVTLTADPDAPSTFTGWSGACTGTAVTCEVTLSEATTVIATFAAPPPPPPPPPEKVRLTVDVEGDGEGRVTSAPGGIDCDDTCSAELDEGTQVTLTASPADGFVFEGWTGGGCSGSDACTVTLSEATTVTATFEPEAASGFTITEISDPGGRVVLRALDEGGNAVGYVVGDDRVRAVKWTAATGELSPLPPDDVPASAVALSDTGVVAIEQDGKGPGWRYDGALTPLGFLGGDETEPQAIAPDGSAIVGYARTSDDEIHAFVHAGARMNDLGPGVAWAINSSGTVIGESGAFEAVVFGTDGRATTPLPLGDGRSVARDVSDGGLVVGECNAGERGTKFVRGFLHDLRNGWTGKVEPRDGELLLRLTRVNRAGTVALGSAMRKNGTGVSFVYLEDGTRHDLAELVDTGDVVLDAVDVNDAGQILALGRDAKKGEVRSLLLTPPPGALTPSGSGGSGPR